MASLVSIERGAASAAATPVIAAAVATPAAAAAGDRLIVSGAGYAPSNGTYLKAPASEDSNGHAKYVKEGDAGRIIRFYTNNCWIIDQAGPAPYQLVGGPSGHDFTTGSGTWQPFQGSIGAPPMPTVTVVSASGVAATPAAAAPTSTVVARFDSVWSTCWACSACCRIS